MFIIFSKTHNEWATLNADTMTKTKRFPLDLKPIPIRKIVIENIATPKRDTQNNQNQFKNNRNKYKIYMKVAASLGNKCDYNMQNHLMRRGTMQTQCNTNQTQ